MKRLEEMSLEELWQLFPIILSPHECRWQVMASREIERLNECLGSMITDIHHVGSTAVKGIMAKPVIDLLVETPDLSFFEPVKGKLIEAGYICMNETDTRIDFNRGYTPAGYADEVYHLHLRLCGDNDEIYFRDYLNRHVDVARAYEALKLSIWKRYEHDRDGYTRAKTDFVRHYTALAKTEQLKS